MEIVYLAAAAWRLPTWFLERNVGRGSCGTEAEFCLRMGLSRGCKQIVGISETVSPPQCEGVAAGVVKGCKIVVRAGLYRRRARKEENRQRHRHRHRHRHSV